MQFNLALVGCGNWAKIVIKNIKLNKNFKIACIICRNKKKLSEFKGIKKYKNIFDVKNIDKIDCFYIAGDPNINYQTIKNIIPYTKSIIIEKPVSLKQNDFYKIEKIIKKNKNIIINQPHYYNDCFKKFVNLSKTLKINKIIILEGGFGPKRVNIESLIDWGVHPLSSILSFDKNIKKINVIKQNNNNVNGYQNYKIKIKKNLIITGNNFKYKIRKIRLRLLNNNTYDCDLVSNVITINKKKTIRVDNNPLQNLLNNFAKNIIENKNLGKKENEFSLKANQFLLKC